MTTPKLQAWAVVCGDKRWRHGEELFSDEDAALAEREERERLSLLFTECGPHFVVRLVPEEKSGD